MRKFIAGCFAAALLVAAQGAAAADLSVAPLYKAPPAAPVSQVYDWTGFYIGANGGGGWGRSYWSASATGMNLSGGQVGGTAGYNWQNGHAVLGIEGDVDWSGLSGSTSSAACPGCSTSDSWMATVRGRAGYAFGGVLPYVTGGLAAGDIHATAPGFAGDSATRAGWTAGGGLEVALPGNWSAKAEYLHVDLGRFGCGLDCGPTPTDNVSMHDDVVRAGLNYRFGWGK